ncbi:MAG: restriction endonuclease, SacI family, partial [Clostridia bacterium]|nr:restriction endonuclease, SacI family [Clostridia bacterium]
MIHVFTYQDKNYIFDTGSSALHECDPATAAYLKSLSDAEVDVTHITDAQLKEILSDVQALKDQGLLYAEETKARPVKSNEVKALCLHVCHDCNFRCRYCFA